MQDRRVRVRRIYDEALPDDGVRVLVDRLWPRGVRKNVLAHGEWASDVAPSSELRKWYGHDPERFAEFRQRYLIELDEPKRQSAVQRLRARAFSGTVTLLTATKDVTLSHAAVLAELLED